MRWSLLRIQKQNKGKQLLRILSMAVAVLLLCGSLPAAASTMEDVPYTSYTYWAGNSSYEPVAMRAVYEAAGRINGESLGVAAFENASYVTLSEDGAVLYILDGGNGRILMVDTATQQLIKEFSSVSDGTETYTFAAASGLYVTAEGIIYIADTENHRVLVADDQQNCLSVIAQPTGYGIPEDFEFLPTRICVDEKGYVYAVSRGCYYGMLVFTEAHEFLSFHGSYTVEGDILNNILSWFTDLFMTNEKSEASQKKLPSEIVDVSLGSDDVLYTLSSKDTGQIKRLGMNGNNTLNIKYGFTNSSADTFNFGENPATFWHKARMYGQTFVALTVDEKGFMYTVDSGRGRVFIYDEECRLLSAFGGGASEGDQVGTFVTPYSVACKQGKLYVLDFVSGDVTYFELTDYGRMYMEAELLTMEGNYEEAYPLWKKVLSLDANNQRAYEGMGKAMLAMENYEEAMKYAELGHDQQTYSEAFKVVQKAYLNTNFWWIFLLCLAVLGALAALLVISKRRQLFRIRNPKLQAALTACIHPFRAFQSIKYQKNTSVGLATLMVVLFYLASVSEDLYGGFMYVVVDTVQYNSLYVLLGTVGVLLLWVIVNWAICTLSDGKGSLKEVYTVSAYCMMPMIVYSLVFIVGSHLIPATGSSVFGLIGAIVMLYTVVMLLIGMTVIHEYTFFKALGMAVVTLLCMLLAAFVLFSLFMLSQQFVSFVVGVIREVILR